MAARRGGLDKGLDSLISPGHSAKAETCKTGGQSSREGC